MQCLQRFYLLYGSVGDRCSVMGNSFAIFTFVFLLNGGQLITLLHSEQPKLHRVLAILSVKGLKKKQDVCLTIL